MDDKRKDKKLVVLRSAPDTETKKDLTFEETELKNKLLEIENKLDCVENALEALGQEKPNSIFADNVFNTVVGAIAIAAATDILANYFNIDKSDIEDLF